MTEHYENSPDALTPVEVAALLRIAKNTVYELVKRGELTAYRAGKKMRFDPRDVQNYINRGKTRTEYPDNTAIGGSEYQRPAPQSGGRPESAPSPLSASFAAQSQIQLQTTHPSTQVPAPSPREPFILCGQDVLLDILASHLEAKIPGLSTFRSFLGSYNGLHELYLGNVHLASSHLWDSATDTYTLPFLPHLLPGVPLTVVRLVSRNVGFYVNRGNPKRIKGWKDLARPDLQFVNREAGSGIRVLVDGKIKQQGIPAAAINGYGRVCTNHLVAATTVARGGGDFAVGSEMAARQVTGVEFIPLQEECYDLVFPTANESLSHFKELLNRVNSAEFRREIEGLGGYGTGETGSIFRV